MEANEAALLALGFVVGGAGPDKVDPAVVAQIVKLHSEYLDSATPTLVDACCKVWFCVLFSKSKLGVRLLVRLVDVFPFHFLTEK